MKLRGVDAVWLGECRDGGGRKRLDGDSGRSRTRDLADDDSERMHAIELAVAIGTDHERGNRLHPASDQPQDVERRFVRPVQVFENEDGGRVAPELSE